MEELPKSSMNVHQVSGGAERALRAASNGTPLTEAHIWELRSAARSDSRCKDEHWFVLFTRAIEAHHGIGEAPAMKTADGNDRTNPAERHQPPKGN